MHFGFSSVVTCLGLRSFWKASKASILVNQFIRVLMHALYIFAYKHKCLMPTSGDSIDLFRIKKKSLEIQRTIILKVSFETLQPRRTFF